MARPAGGVREHRRFEALSKTRSLSGWNQLRLDQLHSIERLAQGEGRGGPDLQDGEVGRNERAIRPGTLVVRRVRLVDQRAQLSECGAQLRCPLGNKMDDRLVAEVDAGL